eukprot:1588147-Pyramimonas_sp.AAC.1
MVRNSAGKFYALALARCTRSRVYLTRVAWFFTVARHLLSDFDEDGGTLVVELMATVCRDDSGVDS